MRNINKIIIHCSDSDIPSHDDISVIDDWHKQRGFKLTLPDGNVMHVGYHYFIQSDGSVQNGRPEEYTGAHCLGHNHDSIGICQHGINKFSDKQFKSLAKLVLKLLNKYDATIHGHNEFSDKDCPGFNIDDFIEKYIANIGSVDVNGKKK
jgi:hypothetical protein